MAVAAPITLLLRRQAEGVGEEGNPSPLPDASYIIAVLQLCNVFFKWGFKASLQMPKYFHT